MEEITRKWTDYLLLPGAVIALFAGVVSIYKDTSWYIYTPLFIVMSVFIMLSMLKRKDIHEFEVLWQTMTVDVTDGSGKEALFTNLVKMKALKDGAHHFDYILYCDGNVENILTKEGSVIDIKKEGGRLLVKTTTERPLKKGEEVDHTLTAKYLEGFTQDMEYWQTAQNTPGTNIKLIILTPSERPIKGFRAYRIIGHSKALLEQQPTRIISGTKAGIALDFKQAKLLEKYRLEWSW